MSDNNTASTNNYSNKYTHEYEIIGAWLRDELQKARDAEHEDYEPYTRQDGTVIGSRT